MIQHQIFQATLFVITDSLFLNVLSDSSLSHRLIENNCLQSDLAISPYLTQLSSAVRS